MYLTCLRRFLFAKIKRSRIKDGLQYCEIWCMYLCLYRAYLQRGYGRSILQNKQQRITNILTKRPLGMMSYTEIYRVDIISYIVSNLIQKNITNKLAKRPLGMMSYTVIYRGDIISYIVSNLIQKNITNKLAKRPLGMMSYTEIYRVHYKLHS